MCWNRGFKSREVTESTSTSCCRAPRTVPSQVRTNAHTHAQPWMFWASSNENIQFTNTLFGRWPMLFISKLVLKPRLCDQFFFCILYPALMSFVPCVVCVKCDMQERLISPALIPLTPNLGVKTESVRDFLSVAKGSANQSSPPQRLKVIK